MSAKSVELLAQVLDQEVAALKEIKNLILQKDEQEVQKRQNEKGEKRNGIRKIFSRSKTVGSGEDRG